MRAWFESAVDISRESVVPKISIFVLLINTEVDYIIGSWVRAQEGDFGCLKAQVTLVSPRPNTCFPQP